MGRCAPGLAFSLAIAGCDDKNHPGARSGESETVVMEGARVFPQSGADVFVATAAALEALNYQVVFISPDRRVLRTGRQLIRTEARMSSGGGGGKGITASTVSHFRQLEVRLEDDKDGTRVRVRPRFFVDDAEVTDHVMGGLSSGELPWLPVFAEVSRNLETLPRQPADPPAGPSASATTF
jgi:hypothetical protein